LTAISFRAMPYAHAPQLKASNVAMIDDPSDDKAKELYALFGLAFYCSSVFEHGVANAIFILELMGKRREVKTREEWESLVDDHFENSFAQTLGRLKNQLIRNQDRSPALSSLISDLDKCVEERIFLAHHFWREHATHWFTAAGRDGMVQRLEAARELFSETDNKLEAAIQPFAARYGFTPDVERVGMELIRREAGSHGQRR
jgi:hypothetical protein